MTTEEEKFKPKDGEEYWSVAWCGDYICVTNNMWNCKQMSSDYMRQYCGNCFHTKEEAEREKYNVYERLTGKKWNGKTTTQGVTNAQTIQTKN